MKDFMEAGKDRLQPDIARDATKAEVTELKRDNSSLKEDLRTGRVVPVYPGTGLRQTKR